MPYAIQLGSFLGIDWGVNLERYWETYPVIFKSYSEAFEEVTKIRLREWDTMNFNLGKYVSYGVNAPKKYPGKPFGDTGEEKKGVMSDEEIERMMKKNNLLLRGKING